MDAVQKSSQNNKIKKLYLWELKKLQQQKKREISKAPSKAAKESISLEFEQREKDLKQKHFPVDSDTPNTEDASSNGIECNLTESMPPTLASSEDHESSFYQTTKPHTLSKAEKRQMKKIQQRQSIFANSEEPIVQDLAKLEKEDIIEYLSDLNMVIHDIAADGHCLYKAVAHQLQFVNIEDEEASTSSTFSYKILRSMTADFIYAKKYEFLPFLDEFYSDEENFRNYCNLIRDTAEWGGDLELRALSLLLQRPIFIYKGLDTSKLYIHGEEFLPATPLRLAYLRHAYTLGEHYNSIIPSHLEKESI
ncbi:OTU family cysteine protease [Cardiosporidium cionae]|uniref:OTU family cysteine protease n=1 Tax=Cardiosporidium cionae TaxID=476202 RepID=A0ABQ7J9Y8_9APIC|nr:OTU family cysteine protease [Cardiosporidium cionae]|eukprot:KAF8820821.1 OTU family cysteine protease [Cardiosporidium cionae]